MEMIDLMFPVGSIYVFAYDCEKKLNTQIKDGVKILNNMIGNWKYIGSQDSILYFIREN